MAINLKDYKKIGVIGGTFDPIHNQHLFIANSAMEKLGLDVVVFMPTGKSPHKDFDYVTDKHHRYNMVSSAISDNEKFLISDIETTSEETSYTFSTLEKFKSMIDVDATIYFIIGADSLYSIHKWKNVDIIAKLCKIVSFNRPNYLENLESSEVIKKHNLEVIIIDDIEADISSTELRYKLYNNKNCKYIVPDSVIDYIKENDLYTQKFSEEFIEYLKEKVASNISGKRYTHTLGVLGVAKKLATIYKCDLSECTVAALLHDYAKEMKKDNMAKYIKENNLFIDDYVKKHIDLAHGLIAKDIAKKQYKIYNEDILNAIEYHTTGRPNMSMVEKIIYLADALDPNREYKSLERLTNLAFTDIDKAMLECVRGKIEYTNRSGRDEHPLSVLTYEYYKKTNIGDKNV